MIKYNPEKDIPDLSGKYILVTGGTAGIGVQTIKLLAAHSPAQIFFTGRSVGGAEKVIKEISASHPSVSVTFIELDLASLASVQAGARKLLSQSQRLDFLICNAGIMATPQGLTKDGYEVQFGTNHLGHALLMKLLLPTLLQTAKRPGADVRVVSLSSEGAGMHPSGGIVFKDLKTTQSFSLLGPWQRYGQSKLANVLYAAEMARKYADSGIFFLSVHPGVFNTGLVSNLSAANRAFVWATTNAKDEKAEGQGAWSTCWAATSKREGIVNGTFYFPVGVPAKNTRDLRNAKLAGELWDWTQTELASWN